MNCNFDETNPIEIENYARKLIGKTFKQILIEEVQEEEKAYELCDYYNNPRGKGSLGNLIEEYYFKYKPNSVSEADFSEAGVELKVTPYEIKKNGELKAGERLVLGMIPNNEPVAETLDEAHILDKIKLMLLILYLRDRNINRIDYSIDYVSLLSLYSKELADDFEVLKSDYEIIKNKIKEGKAHELSESDTMYLGACTKGSTAARSMQPQYYNPTVLAKRRAFSLKQGYMTFLINKYIKPGVVTYEEISKEKNISKNEFEEKVKALISPYIGMTESQLLEAFGSQMRRRKDRYSTFVFKMLGIRGTKSEELEKSNTIVKTIRINKNGRIKESMSFPTIKFKDFVNEEWEESAVYQLFSENRFLFAIFQENNEGELYFKGVKFWNMPMTDLDEMAQYEWLEIQEIIRRGVIFRISGNRVKNNIPTSTKTKIIHMRPHASKAAYYIPSIDFVKGDVDRDADQLPNGDYMTRQCFWLNNKYLEEILVK
ncbi:Sau3AI family type II restriction endonuclease [Ignavigranum ruoffiae]|uniref:Sau3AI family type II restriction endonuclease n=1 Tax=Ignavigranum ruoffiae TaxID=89093 RepID=UPI003B003B9E